MMRVPKSCCLPEIPTASLAMHGRRAPFTTGCSFSSRTLRPRRMRASTACLACINWMIPS